MRAKGFLHTLIEKSRIKIDKRILHTFFLCVEATIDQSYLALVAIGRGLHSHAKLKHRIKRVDRLLGNSTFHRSTEAFYRHLIQHTLLGKVNPIILVDWSGLTPCGEYHVLRAALPSKGRSLTLYEAVFLEKHYGTPYAHKRFLATLKTLLPEGCSPIVVTDAGFRVPWMKYIQALGWDYITRVRHNTLCTEKKASIQWIKCKSLYLKSTKTAKCLGQFLLTKQNKLPCQFYLFKGRQKKRVKKNLKGKKVQSSVSQKHERSAREPWLLATSLDPTQYSAKQIIKIYQQRMQIEESFRDLKNMRNGLGFRHARTRHIGRLSVLLLIGAYALFYLYALGAWAKQKGLHYQLQTNSIKTRNVLSVMQIGRLIQKLIGAPPHKKMMSASLLENYYD